MLGTPPVCDDANACTDDSCDAVLGCQNVPNTAACDDADACTENDVCGGGACGGTPVDCSDGDACNGAEVCAAGVCGPGTPPDCDDSNACTDDSCDILLGCQNTPNDANSCDDGSACTTEVCNAGACDITDNTPAGSCCNPADATLTPIDDGDACTNDVCDALTGQVTHPDNYDPANECCDSLTGTATVIDDGDQCTEDVCNPDGSVDHTVVDIPCVDGLACTENDMCSAGVCAGTPIGGCSGVFITELMYRPIGDLEEGEFLELYNGGLVAVDLSDWSFDGIDFVFPPATLLASGGYLVLADDAVTFSSTYGFAADFEYSGQLANGGEIVQLFDAGFALIDEVIYKDTGLWPITPDGEGPSLERIDPLGAGDDPRNWHASNDVAGHTAGARNSVDSTVLPPWISAVTHPDDPPPATDLDITATVEDALTVDMTYVIDFGSEVTVPMLDDGLSGDGAAGDGVYGATIPGQVAQTLVRFRVTASDANGAITWPRDDDTINYDGTMVFDAALSSALPIVHWLMDPDDFAAALAHKFTDLLEPAVLYYNGVLYDNIRVRVRGQSSRGYPKNHWKVRFPQGHDFFDPALLAIPVDQFNMQSSYSDKSYVREVLSYETFRDAGTPYNLAFPIRVQQNGQFFGLFIFLESMDDDYLERNAIDPDGAWYKAFSDCRSGSLSFITNRYEKKTRLEEDHSDLHAFLGQINSLSGPALTDYLFDNVDIPGMINYLAANCVIHNNDQPAKNYFMYRDTAGTARWVMHPWDMDLTFGRNFGAGGGVLSDGIWADDDMPHPTNALVSPSHPLFGDTNHRKWDNLWNRFIDRVHGEPRIRDMYHRRLRSLMDEVLVDGHYESRIDELAALIAPEAGLDAAAWGQYGQDQTLTEAIDILKDDYLAVRRTHLFGTHQVPGEIPTAQSPGLPVVINELMYHPATDGEDEFIELYNPSTLESVDVSGWRLDGVGLTLPGGSVILPEDYLLVVRNDVMFRATYGSGHFVAAEYNGALDNSGEVIRLLDRNGLVVDEVLYDAVFPWPVDADGTGPSLELIDPSEDNNRVSNWAASLAAGGTPGATNSVGGTVAAVAALHINEVLPVNNSSLSDEQGDFDPWVEIYNAGPSTVELTGLFLSDDFGIVDQWAFPAGLTLCGGEWLIVWCDNEVGEGPLHSNFTLNPAGGAVALFDGAGQLVDYLLYDALAADVSYGKLPDGGSFRSPFLTATPLSSNQPNNAGLILNEYNAVRADRYLGSDDFEGDDAEDTFFGRVQGNGGNWFELVVTVDHLDIRNWQFVWVEQIDTGTLTVSNDPLWSDLRSGTILTFTESTTAGGGLDTDASYDPSSRDWWIHINSFDAQYVTTVTNVPGDGPGNFSVGNDDWQLTILDDTAAAVFGPAGEGIGDASGVNSREVLKLEEDPGPAITALSNYNDGTSSTFGSPNLWSAGATVQDFTALRSIVPPPCVSPVECADGNPCTDDDCVGSVCTHVANTAGCDDGDACTLGDVCSGGVCTGSVQPGCCSFDCDCDDGNSCTQDTCSSGLCDNTTLPDNDPCDDGDACTAGDTCSAGMCTGVAVDCTGLDEDCLMGQCNPATGACEAVIINEGMTCDDSLFCTTGETCTAGVCGAGVATDCTSLDTACTQGVCDEDADACVEQNVNENGPCEDGLFCTIGDMCAAGTCLSGSARDCSNADGQCTLGTCDEGLDACVPSPANEGLGCDDGLFCTSMETCVAGVCTGGAPTDCSATDTACTVGACNEASDICDAVPANEGLACATGLSCAPGGVCYAGSCVGHNTCPPGDVCSAALDDCTPAPTAAVLPIIEGDTWRYFKGTTEPPADWADVLFDDSAWLSGPGGWGYGDGDDMTVLGDMPDNYLSIYVRRSFYVSNPGALSSLTLAVDYDDAFVAYLNGVEIGRDNITGYPPQHATPADSNHEASGGSGSPNPPVVIDLLTWRDVLNASGNVIAVQGHNVTANSTDFSLIVTLDGAIAADPPTVSGVGSRYLAVTPVADLDHVALRVTSVDHPCLTKYVDADGALSPTPIFQSSNDWGTVLVSGEDIVPQSLYHIEADVSGGPEQENLSGPADGATWTWGDADGVDGVTVTDLVCLLDGFRDVFNVCALSGVDLEGTIDQFNPDGQIDVVDIVAELDAFSGVSYPGPAPCGPAPEPPLEAQGPARLIVRPPAAVEPGQSFEVEVAIGTIETLRGYQLALQSSAAESGTIAITHVTIERDRRDYVFRARDDVVAVNARDVQVVSAVPDGVSVGRQPRYLATFTCRTSADARGVFVLSVKKDTQLRGRYNLQVDIDDGAGAKVVVRP